MSFRYTPTHLTIFIHRIPKHYDIQTPQASSIYPESALIYSLYITNMIIFGVSSLYNNPMTIKICLLMHQNIGLNTTGVINMDLL